MPAAEKSATLLERALGAEAIVSSGAKAAIWGRVYRRPQGLSTTEAPSVPV